MGFTEYKADPADIDALVEQRTASLRANRGFSNLLAFGCSVVMGRLAADRRRYRDYGPWWPALKEVLRRQGHDLGKASDPLIAAEYRLGTDVATLIAADEFRTVYLARNFVYTNQFMLDADSPESWTLYDADMEVPAGA